MFCRMLNEKGAHSAQVHMLQSMFGPQDMSNSSVPHRGPTGSKQDTGSVDAIQVVTVGVKVEGSNLGLDQVDDEVRASVALPHNLRR